MQALDLSLALPRRLLVLILYRLHLIVLDVRVGIAQPRANVLELELVVVLSSEDRLVALSPRTLLAHVDVPHQVVVVPPAYLASSRDWRVILVVLVVLVVIALCRPSLASRSLTLGNLDVGICKPAPL